MLTILGIQFTYEAIVFIFLFLASEVIGMNPKMQESSVAQFILHFARIAKYGRKEDDQIEQIKNILRGGGR
jgi:hypothetical protein